MSKISKLNSLPDGNLSQPGDMIVLPSGREFILNNNNEWVLKKSGIYVEDNGFLSTENLNLILNQGIYHQTLNINSTLTRNYPITSAGILEVYNNGLDQVFQRYTVLSGQIGQNVIFNRGFFNGVWSDWLRFWNSNDFNDTDINNWKNNSLISHKHKINSDFTGVLNSINKEFTLPELFNDNTTQVYLNGIRQKIGINYDYIEKDNNKIIFNEAPDDLDTIIIDYIIKNN